jgi:competence protein ComEC
MRRRPLCLAAVFLLLILWIVPKDVWYEKPDIPSGKEMLLTGVVSKREQKEDKTVYYLKNCLNEQTGSKFSVCAYTPKGDSHPVGCELSLYGTIYQVNEADNPGQFDARDYYQSQGILYTFQAKDVVSAKGRAYVKDSLTNFREYLGGKLEELFSV